MVLLDVLKTGDEMVYFHPRKNHQSTEYQFKIF
jgi:hypothetical protein